MTGNATAPTPEMGAMTPIRPEASPRYRKAVPAPLPTPPRTAQARSVPVGSPPTTSATTRTAPAPATCATSATDHAGARCEVTPPTKSDRP